MRGRAWAAAATALACAACDQQPTVGPAPEHWTYPPPPAAWPFARVHGRLGRSLAPQEVTRAGLLGTPARPLSLPRLWPVPGEPARAVIQGFDGDLFAIDLVDIDAGAVIWRDDRACIGSVVGVAGQSIVCSDGHVTRGISLSDHVAWSYELPAVAITDDRVVLARDDGVVEVIDADAGSGLAITKLPRTDMRVIAACGSKADELYAALPDGKLARVASGSLTWTDEIGRIVELDACRGEVVVVTTSDAVGRERSLVALARSSGAIRGRVDGVRASWPARDGQDRVEIATATGVDSWPRDLSGDRRTLSLPPLGELLARRGDRRLVRANERAAALLDRHGLRAYVALAEGSVVLGSDHVLAVAAASTVDSLRRLALPGRMTRSWRSWQLGDRAMLPAELRDLPATQRLEEGAAFATTLAASDDDLTVGLDLLETATLYVMTRGALARVDLDSHRWRWSVEAGCRSGPAIARTTVACATDGSVHAFDKDGVVRWATMVEGIEAIEAAGDAVLAFAGARAEVLDAADGHRLGTIASDDGARIPAAVVAVGDTSLVFVYARGQLSALVPRAAMVPAWTLAVDGIVREIVPAGDGVIVVLVDGDAYRVDARTATVTALSGFDLGWYGGRDVLAGVTAGEPMPPARMPLEPPIVAKPAPRYEHPENPPPIATPWQVIERGSRAWQLTVYNTTGAFVARADLAFGVARLAAARARSAPFVVLDPLTPTAVVVDVQRANPLRRVAIPRDIRDTALFSTVVAGAPVAGVVLANPLRVVTF
jgi:hypothetical protein